MGTEYRVELDAYAGPLDLLLFLIKEAEVDIYDIPISDVTNKYLEHLEAIQKIDLNRAGEFLVVASQLMEIKAKMLIPRETLDLDDVEDPRSSLVQELLEYRKFKDASRELGDRLSEENRRFPRPVEAEIDGKPPEPEEEDLEDLGVFDLLTAFSRIRKEILDIPPPSIIYDDIPIRVHMEQLLEQLSSRPAIGFRDLILGVADRQAMIGVFLALLELVKMHRIRARQSDDSSDILITLREGGPLPDVETTSASESPSPTVDEPPSPTEPIKSSDPDHAM